LLHRVHACSTPPCVGLAKLSAHLYAPTVWQQGERCTIPISLVSRRSREAA
jgi:hypothetical protein